MKTSVLILVVAMAYTAVAVPIEAEEKLPRFIEFPDGDGVMHIVDLEAEPDFALLDEVGRNPANNAYVLFTRRNPEHGQELAIHNAQSVRQSNFNSRNPIVVIVHGWLGNQNNGINSAIREAYLNHRDVNVIVMDWRRLARADYITAVRGVPDVGRGLGQFLEFLCQTTGARHNSIHLIGFSLGAHVVGNAGRQLGGRVGRITALDPAGPLWNLNSNKVRPADAIYVEGIHTDGGLNGLGIGSNIGDADFYPNGGNNQPGCITGICDHNRAWELFASSVTHNHLIANECSSNLQITLNNCRGKEVPMGNGDINKYVTGMYRVNTGRRYPY